MKKIIVSIAFLALVMQVSVCGTAFSSDHTPAAGDRTEITAAAGTAEKADSETAADNLSDGPEVFHFDPHVHTELISEVCREEWWESFYNLCDAIRSGADTFECCEKDAYLWCTDDTTLSTFFPAACTLVKGDGYEDGVGQISYQRPKDEILARQKAFEEEIERMINEAVRPDYTDFEKCLALFDYISSNFTYDDAPVDGQGIDEFSNYACLMSKKGICCEIAGSYTYLLLQCGIEAADMSGEGMAGAHDWTYIVIDGKGYHADVTWTLHGDFPDDPCSLVYFLQTDDERAADGFEKDSFKPDLICYWKNDYDRTVFAAEDNRYRALHEDGWTILLDMNTDRKVIRYKNINDEVLEFRYE